MSLVVESKYELVNAKKYLSLETGKRPLSEVTDNPEDIPSLGGENISEEGFLKFDNLRYISKEYFEKTIKGKIKNYQILMNKDGAQTGKIAFVENFKFEKAMINEHVFIITSSEEFNNKFVFYYLLSHNGMKQVKSKIVGSAQGGLSNGFFKGILLPKPELPIQDKIADVLSLVDNNIEQTKKVIEKAEKLKKSMMQNLLTGRMKPDGTYRKNEELKETIVGEIPKSWKLIKAKDFCSFVTDGTHDTPKPTSAGFKLLTSKNLTGKGIDLSDSYFISEKDYTQVNKRSKVEKYDVLYGMIGTIGNPEIVLFDEVNFAIKNVGLFKMDKQEHKSFWLKCYLDSTAYSNYVRKMTAGTTQSFVGLGFLRKILIPTPFIDNKINMDEIINISSKLKVAELKLIESRNKLQSLEKLKKSLMQNLLTGKIEIPENLTIKQGVVA